MGNYISIRYNRTIQIIVVLILSFFLLSPGILGFEYLSKQQTNYDQIPTSSISKKIELTPESDYYIKFNSNNLMLEEIVNEPYVCNLSDKVILAIAKSPIWIRQDLIRQFHNIENPEEYADLLLNAPKKFCDEISFSIAHASLGKVPSPQILYDNAYLLYEIDKLILYADIIDYDDSEGNYFSTVKYRIIEDDLGEYAFFTPVFKDNRISLVVNPKHRFYKSLYRPLKDGQILKQEDLVQLIQLLLLSAARAETAISKVPERRVIAAFRKEWSEVLNTFLKP